jgi:hypothetical protein
MKVAASLFLSAALACAAPNEKPACKAGNNGQFWPPEANSGHAAFQHFAQSGELQICTLVVWKYQWEFLTVNVHAKTHKPATASKKANPSPELRSSD